MQEDRARLKWPTVCADLATTQVMLLMAKLSRYVLGVLFDIAFLTVQHQLLGDVPQQCRYATHSGEPSCHQLYAAVTGATRCASFSCPRLVPRAQTHGHSCTKHEDSTTDYAVARNGSPRIATC